MLACIPHVLEFSSAELKYQFELGDHKKGMVDDPSFSFYSVC